MAKKQTKVVDINEKIMITAELGQIPVSSDIINVINRSKKVIYKTDSKYPWLGGVSSYHGPKMSDIMGIMNDFAADYTNIELRQKSIDYDEASTVCLVGQRLETDIERDVRVYNHNLQLTQQRDRDLAELKRLQAKLGV